MKCGLTLPRNACLCDSALPPAKNKSGRGGDRLSRPAPLRRGSFWRKSTLHSTQRRQRLVSVTACSHSPCPRRAPCVATADGHSGDKGLPGEGLRSNDPAAATPSPERGLPPGSVHSQHACLGAGGFLPEDGLPE